MVEGMPQLASSQQPVKRFVARPPRPSTSTFTSNAAAAAAAAAAAVDPLMLLAIAHLLPVNYNFEVVKSIAQINKNKATRIALQLPEGLLMYACSLVDIIERFSSASECIIMGDVTYGACCIDDYTARALGCDMMIHYGHSCLVPVDTTTIKTLYVFVEIQVDRVHLADSIRLNFPKCIARIPSPGARSKGKGPQLEIAVETGSPSLSSATQNEADVSRKRATKLAVVGTIQFVAAVQGLKDDLERDPPPVANDEQDNNRLAITAAGMEGIDAVHDEKSAEIVIEHPKFEVVVPQIKPLSPGEILGCTAPKLSSDVEALIYVGDGRFHLESIMIANPLVPAFRYDPYTKRLTHELYEHEEMRRLRGKAVEEAKESLRIGERLRREGREEESDLWAVVLGTLGRQGNLRVLRAVTRHLSATSSTPVLAPITSSSSSPISSTPFIPILLSELSPAKLSLFTHISTFVQTSCPRLSIDWGYAFERPLLSTYEASVALGVGNARKGWNGMGEMTAAIAQGLEQSNAAEMEEEEGGDYPMDFYADQSLGEWTPRFGMGFKRGTAEKGRPMPRRAAAASRVAVVA